MADIVFTGQTAGGPLNSGAMPSNQDLVVYKGDFVSMVLNIKDSAGNPIDLTGTEPRATLKSDYSDRNSHPFTCTLLSTPGAVQILLPSEVTGKLLPGSYIWDFQITFTNGQTRTYLTGDVTVFNEVTE